MLKEPLSNFFEINSVIDELKLEQLRILYEHCTIEELEFIITNIKKIKKMPRVNLNIEEQT